MKLNLCSFLFPTLMMLVSCDMLYDEGHWNVESRNTAAFDQIEIQNVVDVYYFKSDTFSIDVYFYNKHLNAIKTTVTDQKMSISSTFKANWFTDIRIPRIDIYAPYLTNVYIHQAAGFFCEDTLQTHEFSFTMSGDVFESDILINTPYLYINIQNAVGLMNTEGIANFVKVQNRGETRIQAYGLAADSLNIVHQSVMDAFFSVSQYLKYKLLRNGNLFVVGEPEAEGRKLGNGKLILQDEN